MRVETFIKAEKGLVPIDGAAGPLADPDYVEGALVLTVNDVELFTEELWDYVDQLWEYLIDAVLDALSGGREASFFFPDQPIEVKIRPTWNGRGIEVAVLRRKSQMRASTDKKGFVLALCEAGEKFFRKMRELHPTNQTADEQVLAKLRKLRQAGD